MYLSATLPSKAGGVRVQVPFFQPIEEEQIKSDNEWGTSGAGYLTPQNIEADKSDHDHHASWLCLRRR